VPPRQLGGIDISPIILGLLIVFIDSFLINSLTMYAQQLIRGNQISF
jgi:YggT family protein